MAIFDMYEFNIGKLLKSTILPNILQNIIIDYVKFNISIDILQYMIYMKEYYMYIKDPNFNEYAWHTIYQDLIKNRYIKSFMENNNELLQINKEIFIHHNIVNISFVKNIEANYGVIRKIGEYNIRIKDDVIYNKLILPIVFDFIGQIKLGKPIMIDNVEVVSVYSDGTIDIFIYVRF